LAHIKLNKSHLFHNLLQIEKQTKDKNKIAVVLKDNAYGHGLLEMASLCQEYGIKYAVVQSVWEAQQIVTMFDNILILADTTPHTYSHTFHIAINDLEDIQHIQKKTKVQLKVDTGMHRNGIAMNELKEAIYGALKKDLEITGIFTHFKSADELGTSYFWQKMNFNQVKHEVKTICEQLKIPLPLFHSCNSSAIFRENNFQEDLCRAGISIYGYIDTQSILNPPLLKPVLSLWGKKVSSRILKKGQSVGYGGVYQAKEDMQTATYNVGYGDGFFRLNGKKPFFTPKGYEVLGKVSMDSLSLNTNDEEVCIFDDATTLAKLHDTISYEIITSLKPHLPKEIV
jgi:alanine racemase